MGSLVLNSNQVMDHIQATTSGTKIERRVIEKNRRNHMKILYSQLYSLLPNQNSKEPLSLPEQVDEAINYIKTLESNLQKSKQKRDSLKFDRKRSYELYSSNICESSSAAPTKLPELQIHENGSTLEVVLSTGLHNQFILYDIIRVLDQEQADVVHSSFSTCGDSILHLLRAEMGNLMLDYGVARITEKLKRIVYGSASDGELQHDEQDYLWDFQLDTTSDVGFLI